MRKQKLQGMKIDVSIKPKEPLLLMRWVADGCPPIELGKYGVDILRMANEVKRLRLMEQMFQAYLNRSKKPMVVRTKAKGHYVNLVVEDLTYCSLTGHALYPPKDDEWGILVTPQNKKYQYCMILLQDCTLIS